MKNPKNISGLGDVIERTLSSVGVTPQLVENWLGVPCGCKERQDRLNQLTYWARTAVKRKGDNLLSVLKGIIGASGDS